MSTEIADQLAIRSLIDRYSDAITRRDFDCVASLFAEDAVWQVDAPFEMKFEGAAIATTIAAGLANCELSLQMAMGSVIEIQGDRATARTTIHEMISGPMTRVNQFGVYEDTLVRTDVWRFALRRFRPYYLDASPLPGTIVKPSAD